MLTFENSKNFMHQHSKDHYYMFCCIKYATFWILASSDVKSHSAHSFPKYMCMSKCEHIDIRKKKTTSKGKLNPCYRNHSLFILWYTDRFFPTAMNWTQGSTILHKSSTVEVYSGSECALFFLGTRLHFVPSHKRKKEHKRKIFN